MRGRVRSWPRHRWPRRSAGPACRRASHRAGRHSRAGRQGVLHGSARWPGRLRPRAGRPVASGRCGRGERANGLQGAPGSRPAPPVAGQVQRPAPTLPAARPGAPIPAPDPGRPPRSRGRRRPYRTQGGPRRPAPMGSARRRPRAATGEAIERPPVRGRIGREPGSENGVPARSVAPPPVVPRTEPMRQSPRRSRERCGAAARRRGRAPPTPCDRSNRPVDSAARPSKPSATPSNRTVAEPRSRKPPGRF